MASFAQTHWEAFERLAVEFLVDQFRISPSKIWRTVASGDGGYDGGAIVELAEIAGQVIAHKVMLEAKLRSDRRDLELAAFAKTMIVGFNLGVNSLVIVTNLDYSAQALREARDFAYRARLEVILVDGGTLSGWMRAHWGELASRYGQEFLSALLRGEREERSRRVEVLQTASDDFAPAAEIHFGFENGKASPCRLELRSETPADAYPAETIVGHDRQQTMKALQTSVSATSRAGGTPPPRYVLLHGEMGVGKSLFLRVLARDLTAKGRPFITMRLDATATPHSLFLRTLEAISGVSILRAAGDVADGNLATFLHEITGHHLSERVISGAAAVLSRQPPAAARAEIDQLVLVDFIKHLLEARAPRPAAVISFEDVHAAPPEVLDFMHPLTLALYERQYSVIVEARESHDVATGPDGWSAFLHRVRQIPTLVEFTVPSPTSDDAIAYVGSKLAGLDESRARFIVSRVGTNPLLLEVASDWLLETGVLRSEGSAVTYIEEHETFFENLTPETAVSIIDRKIAHWLQRDTSTTKLLMTAALLHGDVPPAAVVAVTDEAPSLGLDRLLATKLFYATPSLSQVSLKHTLLRERLQALTEDVAYRFRRRDIAEQLLPHVSAVYANPIDQVAATADLLAASGSVARASDVAHEAGLQLRQQHQWQRAAHYMRQSFRFAQEMLAVGQGGSAWRHLCLDRLLSFLEIEEERYRLLLSENVGLLARLADFSRDDSVLPGSANEVGTLEFRLRAAFLHWRRDFVQERFEQALATAKELADLAQASGDIPDSVGGKVVAALGITHKALRNEEDSRRAFVRAKSRYPNSVALQIQDWSNEAAYLLQTDPVAAHALYSKIIDLQDERTAPFLAILHATVDLAMASLLATRYSQADFEARNAILLAEANGIPAQSARATNTLGCCLWVAGREQQAERAFDRACLDAERSFMHRFLWRIQTNQASVLLRLGDAQRAAVLANVASRHITRSRAGMWPSARDAYRTRWYAALLQIGRILSVAGRRDDVHELSASVPIVGFVDHLAEAVTGKLPAAVFDGNTHLHGGQIMITG